MTRPITNPDTTPPSAPGDAHRRPATLTAAQLSWGARDRQRRRRPLQRPPRRRRAGFTPSAAQPVAQPTGTTLHRHGRGRHLLLQGDGRGRGRQHRAGLERGKRQRRRHVAAVGARDADRDGCVGTRDANWGAATDNVGVVRYNVHRGTTAGFTPTAANRIAQPTGTSLHRHRLAAGTYFYRVTAEDAAGNIGPPSNEASATVTTDTTAPTAPTGLAAGHRQARSTSAGRRRPTTWASSATTSTAARPPASLRARRTGSRSRPARRYADTRPRDGTYYYKVTAEDAAGNVSAASNEIGRDDRRRDRADGARRACTAGVAGSTVNLSLDGRDRQRRRRAVQRPPRRRRAASRRRRRTGSRSRPARATRTPASPPGTLLLQGHRRGRRRQRRPRLQHGQRDRRRHHARRRAPAGLTATGGAGQAALTLDRVDRQRRRHPLQRPPLDDRRASRRAPRTGSRSRRARATRTPASRPAPTTTR